MLLFYERFDALLALAISLHMVRGQDTNKLLRVCFRFLRRLLYIVVENVCDGKRNPT